MRKTYLDNIRWITVLLVVIYHVIYMFNGEMVFSVIGPFSETQYQDAYMYIVYPWFMLILFVVSGMSARFYLENHTHKEFIRSKTVKLLVPSTIGLFVFYWILGYYNMALGGAFESFPDTIPKAIMYLIMAASGIGPLWYIQVLWIFSLILVLIRKIEKDRLYNLCGKTNAVVLILMAVATWGAAQILNTPIITVYRFGIYGFGFLVGYFCLSHDEVMDRLSKLSIPLVIASVILGTAFTIVYWKQPYAESPVLTTPLCNFYAWIMVLAIMAFMKKHGDFENGLSKFMISQSWGLYLFHYLPIAVSAYYLNIYASGLHPVFHYLIVGVSAFAVSFILNEVIKRIPFIRWCVMGISKRRTK